MDEKEGKVTLPVYRVPFMSSIGWASATTRSDVVLLYSN